MSDDEESLEPMPASLENILESNLRWIFVGGKGGVGKTTTSCSLAVQLSLVRESVLVVSTDPAHNLSDAFGQKFTSAPTKVNGFPNLFCMEVEASAMQASMQAEMGDAAGLGMGDAAGGLQSLMKDLTNAVPGIDEAMSFAEIMKSVQTMEYQCIVFDTAPTGHTLRLLSMPNALEKAFAKIMELKNKFGGLLGQAAAMMGGAGGGAGMQESMLDKLESTRAVVQQVNVSFKDPEYTTFVCVCIPEFLSLYETERLVQELTKYGIDAHNVVVNQVLFAEPDACRKFLARKRMQDKYLNQIHELYEDFHVVVMPMCDAEVRGPEALRRFSRNLIEPYDPVPVKDTSTEAVLESVAAKFGLDLDEVKSFLRGEGLLPPTDGGEA